MTEAMASARRGERWRLNWLARCQRCPEVVRTGVMTPSLCCISSIYLYLDRRTRRCQGVRRSDGRMTIRLEISCGGGDGGGRVPDTLTPDTFAKVLTGFGSGCQAVFKVSAEPSGDRK